MPVIRASRGRPAPHHPDGTRPGIRARGAAPVPPILRPRGLPRHDAGVEAMAGALVCVRPRPGDAAARRRPMRAPRDSLQAPAIAPRPAAHHVPLWNITP